MRWRMLAILAVVSISAPAMAGKLTLAARPAAPVIGGQDAQDQERAPITVTGVKDRKQRVICKGAVATGSLIAKKTCRTGAEWDDREEKDRATHRRMQEEQRGRVATQNNICMENPTRCSGATRGRP